MKPASRWVATPGAGVVVPVGGNPGAHFPGLRPGPTAKWSAACILPIPFMAARRSDWSLGTTSRGGIQVLGTLGGRYRGSRCRSGPLRCLAPKSDHEWTSLGGIGRSPTGAFWEAVGIRWHRRVCGDVDGSPSPIPQRASKAFAITICGDPERSGTSKLAGPRRGRRAIANAFRRLSVRRPQSSRLPVPPRPAGASAARAAGH